MIVADMELLAPLHAALPEDFPEQLRELAEVQFLQLLEEADAIGTRDPHVLAGVAYRQADRISLELGGVPFYVPKGMSYRLSPRNRQIALEFRGDYKKLARKWGLSEQQVRNIVDSHAREAFLQRQGDMFPGRPAGSAEK